MTEKMKVGMRKIDIKREKERGKIIRETKSEIDLFRDKCRKRERKEKTKNNILRKNERNRERVRYRVGEKRVRERISEKKFNYD